MLRILVCLLLFTPLAAAQNVPLEITADTQLDPARTYGALIIRKSGVTIDGQGAWLIGSATDSGLATKNFKGTAILAEGVSNVTIRNINARGWETGLVVRNASGWLIENCNFSDNFHDPDFGWGENGRRGGILLDHVTRSTLLRNRANRVWDGCVLLNSDDNLLVDNDFSHCSNTCLKLWTACRNSIRHNVLSHGIRIAPNEVHARDSTSVLIESGSCFNSMLHNDCTHGGDGIFIRVLNGWCSTDNYFEGNDCSYANNNAVECWAPRNTFVANRANHSSYGFWMGGSDQTRLIGNEASFNGLASGHHNSPHLPDSGHAGIVFMFGSSSHTLARANRCAGNNGAGIAIIGDQPSQGRKWHAWHWVLQQNQLVENRWGIYAQYADWITLADNTCSHNSAGDVFQADGVTNLTELSTDAPAESPDSPPQVTINGPDVLQIGQSGDWTVDIRHSTKTSAASLPDPHSCTWQVDREALTSGTSVQRQFAEPGFHRIAVTVVVAGHVELAWRNVYVIQAVTELGTEHNGAGWGIADFHDRTLSTQQTSQARFTAVSDAALIGQQALQINIAPYAGFRVALTWPQDHSLKIPGDEAQYLSIWMKTINSDVTGWQGGPFLVLHGTDGSRCYLEPAEGRDLMRELEFSEQREAWRRLQIPLKGSEDWVRDGQIPEKISAVSLCVDSWGAPDLQLWLDGLAITPNKSATP